ncbi:MAG: TRAFs-binding domain-containing protein [Rhodospirillaceae bacterium]|nr:TRAFs-binding domain-containing protein [Rhodospirillaceae bacterium]
MSEAAILAEATRLEHGGDLLAAYDAVAAGLAVEPASLALRHRAVLLLARSGAQAQAQREYLRLGLDAVHDHVDIMSLGGRLLKDLAFAASGDARRALARAAAEKYAEAYALHRDYYPGINLATLALIAGDAPRSSSVARAVLEGLPSTGDDAYYRAATRAEACFLLGRLDEAEAALAAALALDPGNHTAHASTLRQLDAICGALQIDRAWLERHSPPAPVVYCGHIFQTLAPEALQRLSADIAAALGRLKPGAAFGALAAGADIMVAEAALARGAELHVVLPMDEKTFLARSVTPSGAEWMTRYQACKQRAATFRVASRENDFDDDAVFVFGSELAMGLAIRHGDALRSRAAQLAVWDGVASGGVAGTGADVRRWAATKRRQEIVALPPRSPAARVTAAAAAAPRKLKAEMFADVRGFSRLAESEIRPFVTGIKAPLARALKDSGVRLDLVATWGDGLHMVCASVAEAATAALALQAGFAGIDLAASGLPPHLALRIGGHFGPVAEETDPFMERRSFYGTHVTIAARIEPVAVPGSVYISEPFAALLALEAPGRFATDYVGQTELPKGFGTMRLFSLRHADARG